VTYSRKVFVPLTRLCRDRCHYCTFATVPGRLPAPFLSVDEVVELARRARRSGCKEALFTLGDRPEERWDAARAWLDEAGYDSTLAYVRAVRDRRARADGLLPHLNPGVMSWAEIQRLKPVAPSLGMMLETTADVPAHAGSPDKVPAVRLQVLEDAGRHAVPFTTGLLVGIGETLRDRAETVFAIRAAHRRHGHVQEVIVQNFRAKDDTAMRSAPDAGWTSTSPPSPSRGSSWARACACRRRPTSSTSPRRRCSCAPASTTGAASARSRPTTSTPSGPGRRSRRWPA
jgi:FO synthase